MDDIELREEIYERTIELFYEPDEEVYTTRPLFPRPYPLLHLPYNLASAAIDAMAEYEECGELNGIELIKVRDEIVSRVEESIEDWVPITLGRLVIAELLNNYGGPGKSFCPN
jgi:hypothetical protein